MLSADHPRSTGLSPVITYAFATPELTYPASGLPARPVLELNRGAGSGKMAFNPFHHKKLKMRTVKSLLMLLALMGMVFFTACNNNQSTAEEVQEDMENAAEEVADAFRAEQEELAAELEDLQSNINRRIQELQVDLRDASDEASVEINQQIQQLQAWSSDLDQEMERVGESMSDNWDNVKSDAQQMLSNIEREWNENFTDEG
jgi:DNA anti-recombination protein RmuC